MYCSNCGQELPERAAFCPACQSPVGPGSSTQDADADSGDKSFKSQVRDAVTTTINELAGGEGYVKLRFGDFFTGIFKHHEKGESERLFICGTKDTTPQLKDVSAEWPRPWVYSRVALALGVLSLIFYAVTIAFDSFVGLGNLILFGSLLAPFAALVFFFETNALRNISIVDVIKLFTVGGAVVALASVALESPLNITSSTDYLGYVCIAAIEELSRAACIVFAVYRLKQCNYILCGILVGAAIGAGFGAFESIGYALMCYANFGLDSAISTIITRDVLAIGAHTTWGAIQGGALLLAFKPTAQRKIPVASRQFLIFVAICFVCHFLWNVDIPFYDVAAGVIGLNAIRLLLTVFAWIVIGVLLERGLTQLNAAIAEDAARS